MKHKISLIDISFVYAEPRGNQTELEVTPNLKKFAHDKLVLVSLFNKENDVI